MQILCRTFIPITVGVERLVVAPVVDAVDAVVAVVTVVGAWVVGVGVATVGPITEAAGKLTSDFSNKIQHCKFAQIQTNFYE